LPVTSTIFAEFVDSRLPQARLRIAPRVVLFFHQQVNRTALGQPRPMGWPFCRHFVPHGLCFFAVLAHLLSPATVIAFPGCAFLSTAAMVVALHGSEVLSLIAPAGFSYVPASGPLDSFEPILRDQTGSRQHVGE
jgi:hypothetical protein